MVCRGRAACRAWRSADSTLGTGGRSVGAVWGLGMGGGATGAGNGAGVGAVWGLGMGGGATGAGNGATAGDGASPEDLGWKPAFEEPGAWPRSFSQATSGGSGGMKAAALEPVGNEGVGVGAVWGSGAGGGADGVGIARVERGGAAFATGGRGDGAAPVWDTGAGGCPDIGLAPVLSGAWARAEPRLFADPKRLRIKVY